MWTAPPMPKPEGGKLRRKLQKIGIQQRPSSVNYSDTKTSLEIKSNKRASSFNIFSTFRPSAPQRPPLPASVHSDDGKWLEDFRKNGYLCRDGRSSRQSNSGKDSERPSSVVPEFAHLAINDEKPAPPQERTISSPGRNGPSHQMTRRYAKTPVSHIGQLETPPLLNTQGTSQDIPSIESIAESYRVLLESRCSFMSETTIEKAAIAEKQNESFIAQDPSALPPPLEPVVELPEPPFMRGSPRSDDGTLVAFEEDSIYFKHAPVSSIPSSPSWSDYETASPGLERKTVTPSDSPDLQICLDLLTRKLSSVVNGSPARINADTSALQIWVMIEAYEKLRDQVLETHEGGVNDGPLKTMFDTWLKALHSIHDGMTGGDEQRSESNYED
ncbi:hypothetical protein HD806DRAFT_522195 [Xylariaceae sp. AK1471]|nr:hypothetical protein HD806DRAFT_522195 [Xylariaceae sp. AK1471]